MERSMNERSILRRLSRPLLGVLATAPWQQSSTKIQVDGSGTLRCFESEEVVLTVAAFVICHALLRSRTRAAGQ